MDGGPELQPDPARGEAVRDGARVRHRARQPVELGHHQRVARPQRRQRLVEAGTGAAGPREAAVGVEAILRHAEAGEDPLLRREILAVGRAAGVADEHGGRGEHER